MEGARKENKDIINLIFQFASPIDVDIFVSSSIKFCENELEDFSKSLGYIYNMHFVLFTNDYEEPFNKWNLSDDEYAEHIEEFEGYMKFFYKRPLPTNYKLFINPTTLPGGITSFVATDSDTENDDIKGENKYFTQSIIPLNIYNRHEGDNYEIPLIRSTKRKYGKNPRKHRYFLNTGHDYDKDYLRKWGEEDLISLGKGYESNVKAIEKDFEEKKGGILKS